VKVFYLCNLWLIFLALPKCASISPKAPFSLFLLSSLSSIKNRPGGSICVNLCNLWQPTFAAGAPSLFFSFTLLAQSKIAAGESSMLRALCGKQHSPQALLLSFSPLLS
jgi:hypothetical protein